MSFLDQLKAKKKCLKSTVTNITHADGSQKQILLTKTGDEVLETSRVQLKSKTYGFIVDTKPDFVPACISDDFLYLGSQDAVTQENVQKYKFTDILSIGIETPPSDIDSNAIRTHYVACLDLPETCLEAIVRQSNQIICDVHERTGRILIHCNAGVSRSSTICIAYLILEHKMSFDVAFALVKSKRECIRPNDGFLKQLKQMDHSNGV
ncbi:probable dual specificity protein phosphatase DDB_G0283417 isoform X2 [Contarinia nasturtii]|uniref:probable dual specificity protein phosphatase DDB_G0283417 isoform X2 n=1 Tax=Contarinia nasturtii TaxID=265458 RepID=UPI0012D3CF94|nr:probable dual specificity protein phosphatase DDB_G0283417 isoform X2 [Contarinia nasturtii]